MTEEFIQRMTIETIKEQQANAKASDNRNNLHHLIYLRGFNDGVIELSQKLRDRAVSGTESEDK